MSINSPISECSEAIANVHRTLKSNPVEMGLQYWALINQMVTKIFGMEKEERISLLKTISSDDSGLLLGAARSAAIDSVIEGDKSKLQLGLSALIIENLNEDDRESLIELSLLDNSARRLQTSLEIIFEDLKDLASENIQSLFCSYFQRENRSIGVMGYVESTDKNGQFTYKKQRRI